MLKMNQINQGSAFSLIDMLDDKSIQLIITSPPYWKLRDYGHDDQLGQEESFHEYLDKLLGLFEKCKKVLKDDGLLFVNLADTYYGSNNGKSYVSKKGEKQFLNKGSGKCYQSMQDTIKSKSLVGIPQRFMIAMIDRGWICRNEIIWKKNNVMPASVKDRFTIEHEYVFMFSKGKKYKFHQLKEKAKTKDKSSPRGSKGCQSLQSGNRLSMRTKGNEYTRNVRTVWEINQQPLSIAHYATFPEQLAQRMILCGSDEEDIVLDPFIGSGTVAKAAVKNNRNFIGFELVKKNIEIAKHRISEEL
ncbi:DNA modification methylase [Breznakia sp. PF5-3]|uniref:DNA-methyltransferase n=1 Tax=unclassified Breznakia TaxID=2623764 RepID=UPI0024052A27|nr:MULTISPECIES: site-specific DNA-methyltransferase [unclassified Breznakia]MDF9825197.1 DNA modification methylase [Breznakia sp. PM6-1]MDF9836055.1 DNA modification methylase [Breznakia sp. PF5-3]MDF9838871.1 DNA modification methylase [Breznakia sp. PFB2-8]MDF9860897.1 DNA modification methylase [Breznakia sp. PH5-24]